MFSDDGNDVHRSVLDVKRTCFWSEDVHGKTRLWGNDIDAEEFGIRDRCGGISGGRRQCELIWTEMASNEDLAALIEDKQGGNHLTAEWSCDEITRRWRMFGKRFSVWM